MEKQTIYGQPPSKSNCYRVFKHGSFSTLGKTDALRDYEDKFVMQCMLRDMMIDKRFSIDVDVFFRSDQPDLDNALKTILDCLQYCRAIKNDRLCIEIHARKFIDKLNPRIEFTLTTI